MLARSYRILNRFDDARALDERTVRLMEARLGPEHPETLGAMDNLANDYRDVRCFDDAVALYEKTLAIRQRTLGRDHLETLGGMLRLANASSDLKQHAKAVPLREEVVALQKLKLPADHPELWTSMSFLANGYGVLKRHSEALELHREVLELRKAKFGPDHPLVLWSTWGVVAQLHFLGRGADALPMVEEVVERAVRLEVQPDLVGLLNTQRTYYQQANDVAGCRRTAELWEKLRRTDARSLYDAACYRAVTAAALRASDKSPAAAQESRAEADRAMTWLRQAIAAGYNNIALMKTDSDLDALRAARISRNCWRGWKRSTRSPRSSSRHE